jgi:hypothetical protein
MLPPPPLNDHAAAPPPPSSSCAASPPGSPHANPAARRLRLEIMLVPVAWQSKTRAYVSKGAPHKTPVETPRAFEGDQPTHRPQWEWRARQEAGQSEIESKSRTRNGSSLEGRRPPEGAPCAAAKAQAARHRRRRRGWRPPPPRPVARAGRRRRPLTPRGCPRRLRAAAAQTAPVGAAAVDHSAAPATRGLASPAMQGPAAAVAAAAAAAVHPAAAEALPTTRSPPPFVPADDSLVHRPIDASTQVRLDAPRSKGVWRAQDATAGREKLPSLAVSFWP